MDQKPKTKIRNAAAGLIKSLIRARASQEPEFLTSAEFEHWGVEDCVSDTRPCVQLLNGVRLLQERFERDYLIGQDSIPSPESATEEDELDALVHQVATFIVGDLREAIRIAALGKNVRWTKLANWAELSQIRHSLDRLPRGSVIKKRGMQPVAESDKVILFGPNDAPLVNGVEKERLSETQYKLIRKLIENRPKRSSKSQLEGVNSDYWRVLNNLKESDSDWNEVIDFPGRPHRGYWIS